MNKYINIEEYTSQYYEAQFTVEGIEVNFEYDPLYKDSSVVYFNLKAKNAPAGTREASINIPVKAFLKLVPELNQLRDDMLEMIPELKSKEKENKK